MLPLDGLFVVAIEQAVAAPFCTSRLADAGATVVKIERPEGDFARGYDDAANGMSSYFVWFNRGKQSVALDLTNEVDRAELATPNFPRGRSGSESEARRVGAARLRRREAR